MGRGTTITSSNTPPIAAFIMQQDPAENLNSNLYVGREVKVLNDNKSNIELNSNNLSDIVHFIGIQNSTLIYESITQMNAEEIESAHAEDKLGRMEENESGNITLKFSQQKIKELESLSITSVQIKGSNNLQIYTSFQFQVLSDQELNLLTLHVKAYIVYLKAIEQPKDESDKTQQKIEKYESKLKYLEIERAVRTDNQEKLKILLNNLVNTRHYKIAQELKDILSKAQEEKKIEETQREIQDLKISIVKKEIVRQELFHEIVKGLVNRDVIKSNQILNGQIQSDKKERVIVNMGRFVTLYNAVNKSENLL